MKKICRILFIAIFLLTLIGFKNEQAQASLVALGDNPVITLLQDGLLLDWQIPKATLHSSSTGVQVSISGLVNDITPGLPQLPVLSLLVAIPPESQPWLQINRAEKQLLSADSRVSMAPKHAPVYRSDGSIIESTAENLIPQAPVNVVIYEEVGTMRGVRLGRLVLRPVLLESDQITAYTQLQFKLQFNTMVKPSKTTGDVLLEQVKAMVINPGQIQASLEPTRRVSGQPQPAMAESGEMLMEISQPGMYQVSYADLQAAGFDPAAIDPRSIHISHTGQEVAYEWVSGVQDSIFSLGEALRFIARPVANRWANYDTYTLSVTGTPATLMQTRSATPGSAPVGQIYEQKTFEQNVIYTPDRYFSPPMDPTYNNDPWVWGELRADQSGNYSFDLGLIDSTQTGLLTVYLNGFTSTSHNVEVSINGTYLGTIPDWTGKTAKATQFTIPANKLTNTGNTLTIHLPPGFDGVWFDAFSVRFSPDNTPAAGDVFFVGGSGSGNHQYQVYINSAASALVYNLDTIHAPVRLTGGNGVGNTLSFEDSSTTAFPSYLVTTAPRSLTPNITLRKKTALTASPAGATYVIVSHPEFLAGLSTLVAHRNSKGLVVATQNVKAIYDNFSEGIPNPQAIQDYLKTIYNDWSPKPQYVLLVGDGTWDVKDYLTDQNISYIPPFLKEVDPFTNEEAADNRFVTFDGANDRFPEMLIGRLPVNNLAELSAMVSKIIQYETNPPDGDWMKQGTAIADDTFVPYADYNISAMHPAPQSRQKIYHNVNYPNGDATKIAIIQAWNAGSALMTYTGHGAFVQWGGENLFHIDDIASLTNGFRLPALLELTCQTSRFHMPGFTALDEAFVRWASGGAIITLGSTGLSHPGSQSYISTGFIHSMQGGSVTAGQAMLAGKLKLAALDAPYNYYLIDTFTLLGDPAIKFKLKTLSRNLFLPSITN